MRWVQGFDETGLRCDGCRDSKGWGPGSEGTGAERGWVRGLTGWVEGFTGVEGGLRWDGDPGEREAGHRSAGAAPCVKEKGDG